MGNVSNTADGEDNEEDRLILLVSFCIEPVTSNRQGEEFDVSTVLKKRSDGVFASLPQEKPVQLKVVEPDLVLNVSVTPRYDKIALV